MTGWVVIMGGGFLGVSSFGFVLGEEDKLFFRKQSIKTICCRAKAKTNMVARRKAKIAQAGVIGHPGIFW
ncbi:MAG: hypothetical protein H7838_07625 [Magnetococcus sp. DMHC-8]